jgi:hypothetical protein
MTERSATQRRLSARVAANERWSRLSTEERRAATARARAARMDRYEREVDPDGRLDPAERQILADNAMRAAMSSDGSGRGQEAAVRMTEPLFMYSTRTQAKQIVHRTILGGSWSPRLAGYARTKFLTACGVVLTDPQVADIDTAERFCDACLMADYGHVVYTFLDAAGNALYVGQTNNLLRRMEQHGWSSPWFALTVAVRPPDRSRR